jgi:hypothetical protein
MDLQYFDDLIKEVKGRPLKASEIDLLRRYSPRVGLSGIDTDFTLGNLRLTLVTQGNFTIAHLRLPEDGAVVDGYGAAKRRCDDQEALEVGRNIALTRAWAEMHGKGDTNVATYM